MGSARSHDDILSKGPTRVSQGDRLAHVRLTMHDLISRFSVGEKIPTERKLTEMLSANRNTVRVLLDDLESNSLISREQGRGTFLKDKQNLLQWLHADDKVIGVICPDCSNPMIEQIVEGTRSAGKKSQVAVKVFDTGLSVSGQMDALKRLNKEKVDGLIFYPFKDIVYDREFQAVIRKLLRGGMPMVMIDRYLPEIDTSYVVPDYFNCGYMSARHLIMLGHRVILNLTLAGSGGTAGLTQLRGFRQCLEDYGIMHRDELIREQISDASPLNSGYRIMKEFLSRGSKLPFTAICSDAEGYAYGAYMALKEHGLRVPDDISIVSDDNVNWADYDIGWTTITYPWFDIGRKSVDLINQQLSGNQTLNGPSGHVIMPVSLTVRNSCGASLGRARETSNGSTILHDPQPQKGKSRKAQQAEELVK